MSRIPITLSLAAACAACSAPSFSVEPRVAIPKPSGHLAAATPGGSLVANDVEDALNLEADGASLGIRADIELGSPHIVLAWMQSASDGDGTLTGQLSDDGVILPADTDVATDFDLGLASGIVTFDLVPTEMVEVGIGFGVHVVDLDASVTSRDPGNPGRIDLETTLPVPVLAIQAGVEFGRLELRGLASGMDYSSSGDSATFLDFDVGARFRILGEGVTGSLALGWRYSRLDARYEDDDDNADVDLRLSGPYFGIAIGF